MSQVTPSLLREIMQILKSSERKLDRLLELQKPPFADFVPGTFLSLPKHLRRSMQAMTLSGEATAEQISDRTGRSRAAESDYLNQLVDRSFLKKTRRGREIVFQVFSLHTICPMCSSRVSLNTKYCNHCGALLSK
jgi:hypothetical protein